MIPVSVFFNLTSLPTIILYDAQCYIMIILYDAQCYIMLILLVLLLHFLSKKMSNGRSKENRDRKRSGGQPKTQEHKEERSGKHTEETDNKRPPAGLTGLFPLVIYYTIRIKISNIFSRYEYSLGNYCTRKSKNSNWF